MHYPLDRPNKAAGASTASLGASFKPLTDMEKGVEALLESHGLSDAAMAQTEQLELSKVSEDDVKERLAELKKMRDLLFHHERKLKRASKIKSKAYRRVMKKAKASREEREMALAALDRSTAQRLQLRREVERVRERMTLKHKNMSRWAKRALKQQQKNPALKAAIAEQLAKGEELRRKQMDAGAEGDSEDESEITDSEADDDDDDDLDVDGGEGEEEEDDEEGDEEVGRPAAEAPAERERPALPAAGGGGPGTPHQGRARHGFMKKAVERQRAEAKAVLQQLEVEARQAEAREKRRRSQKGSADDGRTTTTTTRRRRPATPATRW